METVTALMLIKTTKSSFI